MSYFSDYQRTILRFILEAIIFVMGITFLNLEYSRFFRAVDKILSKPLKGVFSPRKQKTLGFDWSRNKKLFFKRVLVRRKDCLRVLS